MKNVIEYLEKTALTHGEKTAVVDATGQSITFSKLYEEIKAVAVSLSDSVKQGEPVLICMDKSIECIEAFLAVAFLGGWYIPVDITLPYQRIAHIVSTVSGHIILTRQSDTLPPELMNICQIFYIEDLLICGKKENVVLPGTQRKVIAQDPLYAIFTSGSTGVPKGVITTHQALFSFIDEMGEQFHFSSEDVIANQVPFYFDASTKDIYLMCKYGCTMYIIPRKLFMIPKQLIDFLNANHVTKIIWTPSLLCMIADLKTLDKYQPEYLDSVFFVGELMPTKQYNIWKTHLPNIQYVNLYGSTEVTGSSTFYVIDRLLEDTEVIPIGRPFGNVDVFLLDEKNRKVDAIDVSGEICIRGSSLSLGYYGDSEQTRKVFQQNPLNDYFGERIYKSGDIGKYNERGELIYICRKDYQIKRMGRRVELGDIEATINAVKGIERACCLFDEKRQDIIAVFAGAVDISQLKVELKNLLPSYMIPNTYHVLEALPLNANGKIDRKKLKEMFLEVNI